MVRPESDNQANDFKMQKLADIIRRPEFAVYEELPETEQELVAWEMENPTKLELLKAADKLLFEELGIKEGEGNIT